MNRCRGRCLILLVTLASACSSAGSKAPEGDAGGSGVQVDAGAGRDAATAAVTLSIRPASSMAAVGEAVGFEAIVTPASADLTLSWDFGDGVRGGGAKIAHAFAREGAFDVTLSAVTVRGELVEATQQIRVVSVLVPGPSVSAVVTIEDLAGEPLSGADVVVDGTSVGASNPEGKLTLSLTSDVPHVLVFKKPGYAEYVRALTWRSTSSAAEHDFSVALLARAAAQTADASEGGTIAGADGASLTLAPNSVANARGEAVSGPIEVSLTSVDVTSKVGVHAFPGEFAGLQSDGARTGIVSHGTTEFVLEKDGERLNLLPGASARIRIPVFAGANLDGSEVKVGSSLPLWSLDESSGGWVQEGSGTVVDVGGGELALEASVSHFSWWNADMPFVPARPKPKCVLLGSDVPGANDYLANASICKMLIDIDRGVPEAKANKNRNLPAFASIGDVPIAGGEGVNVPAGVGLTLRGCILSGLFCGESKLNFEPQADGEVEIRLLPTDPVVAPPDGEGTLITAPYDQEFPFDQPTKSDVYRFQAAQGSVTQLMLSRAAAPGAAKINTGTVRLFRGADLISVSAFDGQGNAGEVPGLLTIVAKTAGEYTIEVAWSEQPVFSQYRLRLLPLSVESRTVPFDAETIPTVSDGFLAYAFDANAEDRLRVFGWFSLYNQAATTKSALTLLRDDGRPLATNPPADQDSQYHFGASPSENERLLLIVYYQAANPPSSRVSVSVGAAQPLPASPAPATEGVLPTYASRAYRFSGLAGQAVKLDLTRGYGYSQMDMRLYNPAGQRMAIPAVSGTPTYSIDTTLPSDGEYIVEVIRGQPISGDAGAYTLTLALTPP